MDKNIFHTVASTLMSIATGMYAILVITALITLTIVAFFFFEYGRSLEKNRDNSYKIVYNLSSYNDAALHVYKQKLRQSINDYLSDENEYTLFKSKIIGEMLGSCVEKRYRYFGDKDAYSNAKHFVTNARNSRIRKDQKIVNRYGKYEKKYYKRLSDFEFNFIRESTEQAIIDSKSYLCELNTSTTKIYHAFLTVYLSRHHLGDGIKPDPWLEFIIEHEPEF